MFTIYDGRIEFYQWDLDRKIIVEDPAIDEVHFCNKTDDCSLVTEVYELNGQRVANVPNILLQDNWDIRVYGYCGKCYTKQAARFKVVGRTKPSDYVYTETEVKSWESIAERCEEVLDVAESLAHGASSGKSFMDYEALISDLNSAKSNKYYNPQHFFIKTLGVPDVWVYEVKEDSVPYEYVDDQTFAQAVTDSVVQVGYYVLSALETQKVVLTDYVKNTDYATYSKAGIAKANAALGIAVGDHGDIRIQPAYRKDILEKTSAYKPICADNNDYAVKVGITTNTETLTDEEKTAACGWLGVTSGDVIDGERHIVAYEPQSKKIGYKRAFATYFGGSYTVMLRDSNGFAHGKTATAESAGTVLVNKEYAEGNFVSKIESTRSSDVPHVYAQSKDGTFLEPVNTTNEGSSIAKRLPNGQLRVSDPTNDADAATKKYVDGLIAELQAQINELKGV